jgi:hypothetical protein
MSTIQGLASGACCYDEWSCTYTDPTTCAQLGGTFYEDYDCSDTNGNGVADVCEGSDPCAGDTQAPVALLDSPGDFACVPLNGYSNIAGIASDPEDHLWYWTLEERGMNEASWTYITSGSQPVYGEFWGWTPAAAGYRMLRLTVLDQCGHASTAVRLVYADQGPTAILNSPGEGAVVGGTVCINGWVSHGVCAISWDLYVRPSGGSWGLIASGNSPAYNQQLATWDTSGLTGPYEFWLMAESIGGMDDALVHFEVDNAAPTVFLAAPTNCQVLDGEIPIYGTVHDPHLASWALQWSGGPSHAWNTIASGTSPVMGGLLGLWDVSELPTCPYALRLVASDTAGVSCTGNAHSSEFVVTVNVGEPGGGGDADLDGDGDVDFNDFALFSLVFTGPL